MAALFKTIAWNGISLEVPGEWDLGAMGRNHLLFGENREPRLEVTWTEVLVWGSLEKQMKRFTVRVRKRLGITVSPLPVLFNQVNPDAPVTLAGFSWKSAASRGRGGLVLCHRCRRIVMFRFFDHYENLSDSLMKTIVGSYEDGCFRDRCSWQLFGLNLSTPDGFRLCRYSFRPGAFFMEFKAQGQGMTVYSWGPASFLLQGGGLEGFARQRADLPDKIPVSGEGETGPFLVWEWQRFPWAFGLLQSYQGFRIWHHRTKNRILGLKCLSNSKEGRKQMEGAIIFHDTKG
ncbi:MAG: hypothetical protein GY737_10880 [Desulfobacteraceae bacterium]|nr:hypothetical protein [Desulfobacteraceae bacterium]